MTNPAILARTDFVHLKVSHTSQMITRASSGTAKKEKERVTF
jgi:hypothetical protein